MTDALEPISHESIPRALEKAERYRLLNEPFFAESICLDVLAIEPGQPRALTTLVLALTDQFGVAEGDRVKRAGEAIAKLGSEYERTYYTGIVAERRAVARLERGGFGAGAAAWRHIRQAIDAYAKAHAIQPDASNDDAVLRRNTCVRLIELHGLHEPPAEDHDYPLE
jgi:hypothetical protein